MDSMRYSKKAKKRIALMLFSVLTSQLLIPNVALALTSGPTQPEVQSFEPVGTTDMVDMFSGDFIYNVPLLDIEGYPVNISYHGGVTMEQEASWVGLGWNINPGEINRTVRGVPDDFNGDTLSKELHIKDDITLRVGVGVGVELFGAGDPFLSLSASLGANVTFNNYRGTSCDFNLGGGINVFHSASVGVNIGVGSQTGADIDYNANLSLSSSQLISKSMAGGIGVGVTQGYSSRSGLSDRSFTYSINASSLSHSFTNTIPIGVKNYVPVITNSSTMNSFSGRVKLGGELLWCLGYVTANGMYSTVHYNNDGSKDAYGYIYMQNAPSANHYSIMDFTRDRDGQFNKTMQYLPPANLTYDIYSVSGQGTGGMFRPYRNDFGSVYDPETKSTQTSESVGIEAGAGWIFELGGDYSDAKTEIKSGPWDGYGKAFVHKTTGSVYEDIYLKQGGELTSVDSQYFRDIHGLTAIVPESYGGLPATKANSAVKRDARGNLVYYFTADESSQPGVGTNPHIVSYTSTNGFSDGANAAKTEINRVGINSLQHRKDEMSEFVQVQKDGRKYVYGIPAMNHVQREATFSVAEPSNDNKSKGIASYSSTDASVSNGQGMDNYYSSTTSPAYAHSYLLSSVLSTDYVDVTGDGITDDDLGSYTKMNYTLKQNDYRWKAPFGAGIAQYSPGFLSDKRDDKGSIVTGSREEWMLHSIETRNFVAEFYTSQRNDACGSTDPIVTSGKYAIAPYNSSSTAAPSYKLDSIKLYNKHDRFINKTSAIPVKTVFFAYTDTLCKGIPNKLTGGADVGKLTLSKIYFRYGSSQRSMISPYQFSYGYNPNYDLASKDRWGSYKPAPSGISNYEYPFVDQDDALNNTYASAWSLTNISLPSGGTIAANYESDDYGFVQDKVADEMFRIKGIGNGPGFNPSTQLYANKTSPYLYMYFQRRLSGEVPGLSFRDNYLKDQTIIYYNFNVKLNDGSESSYEQIKGYATIVDINACPGGVYGYIQLKPVLPAGDDEMNLNPITFTAINTGRYNLPQIIYPGYSSSPTGGFEVLNGLRGAISELVNIFDNPIERLIEKKHDAKNVDLQKSFVRLQSPGLRKKGGGQRIKSLLFYDSWSKLAGGNEQDATYGKTYDYTINDNIYGVISSGVASYEPQVGGDENPFREPAPYIVASGSAFPPNDPVDLYQELPIGESLFPSAGVGYRKVTVKSINAAIGKSAQGIDVSEFYTAKDFPAKVVATAINSSFEHHFDFFSQKNLMSATQGYSLIFNDMHGKPKGVQHYVHHPGSIDQLISYQIYNYHMSGGQLDNNVNCLVYDPGTNGMVVQNKQLGVEADVTLDSRMKEEETKTHTLNCNLNLSGIFIFIFPIILAYEWPGLYKNQFHSATVTKVVQQYGILDNVQAYNEGAVTTQRNELYDPETGQVVVTSINNEYQDKEYTVNVPAWWAYAGMSPSYKNIKYEQNFSSMPIQSNYLAAFEGAYNFNVGDELLVSFNDHTGAPRKVTAWFVDANSEDSNPCGGCCMGYILPRFPNSTAGWTPSTTITNVHMQVVNSGAKNMLNETAESYTMTNDPLESAGGNMRLKTSLSGVISNKAKTFSDSNTRVIRSYLANADTVNPFAIGERGIYRVLSEYTYFTDRTYGLTARTSGLYSCNRFFSSPPEIPGSGSASPNLPVSRRCVQFPYGYVSPGNDPNWRIARTITKWSPYGQEVENKDAVGNYSSSTFGYNHDLPTSVASNAKQGEVLAESFEDYTMLNFSRNIMHFNYSPFTNYFDTVSLSPVSPLYNMYKLNNASDLDIVSTSAHTGLYALSVPVSSGGTTGIYAINIPINTNSYTGMATHYNAYFEPSLYSFKSDNEYLPFKLNKDKKYLLSFWVKQSGTTPNLTTYALHDSCGIRVDGVVYRVVKKSNIIDGWQQLEVSFKVPSSASSVKFRMPVNYLVDDIRFFPADANMKSFVYNPVNQKLMATLDENNFSTLYEYDQEGNLVRVKKETEKGIMTISESRSSNPKQ